MSTSLLSLLSTFCVGNFDFVTANEEVSFENEQVQCVDIQILNDQLTENLEAFRVNLKNGFDILSTTFVIIRSSNSMKYTQAMCHTPCML